MRLVTSLFLLSIAVSTANQALAQANIAIIGGKPLTADEYKAAAASLGDRPDMLLSNPNLRRRFLDDLINNSLLAKTAEKAKIDESQEFKDQLAIARNQILARLYMKKYIAEKTTDKDVAAYFEREKLNFSNREAFVKHIIIKDEKKAEQALAALKANPGDFDKLLETYAGQNPAGQKGGSMGFVGRGRLIEDLENAVFSTPKGGIYPKVLKTSFGYHVLMVTDFKGTDETKLADVREKVLEEMEHRLRKDLIKNQREASGVTIDDNALKSVKFE